MNRMSKANQTKGRPKGGGHFDGQRFTVRLPADLSQRLFDRARGRADLQAPRRTDRTHADSQPTGQVSDIIREAVQHYLDGCDRELQTELKAPAPKRARPAKATKG
jgi:hypothetical protein